MTSKNHPPEWVPAIVCDLLAAFRAAGESSEELSNALASFERIVYGVQCKKLWIDAGTHLTDSDLSNLCIELLLIDFYWDCRLKARQIEEIIDNFTDCASDLCLLGYDDLARGVERAKFFCEAELKVALRTPSTKNTPHAKRNFAVWRLAPLFLKLKDPHARLADVISELTGDVVEPSEIRKLVQRYAQKYQSEFQTPT